MRAMFHELVRRGTPVTLLFSVRSPKEAAFAEVRSAQLPWTTHQDASEPTKML